MMSALPWVVLHLGVPECLERIKGRLGALGISQASSLLQ
jgi:hypothetical protein